MFTVNSLGGNSKKIETLHCKDYARISSSEKFCILPKRYADLHAEQISKMEVYEDDVWVISFPKSGTTWTEELVWLVSNDLDYEKALTVQQGTRFPFLELDGLMEMKTDSVELCKNLPRPRHINSHLPIFLLPDEIMSTSKIVYVARDPRDVAVSYFHHYTNVFGYRGSKEDFIECFLNNQVICSPYSQHVMDFWNVRHQSNVLFIFYEDMIKDLEAVVRRVVEFFGKNFSQSEIDALCGHLSFDSMRANQACNKDGLIKHMRGLMGEQGTSDFRFIRKGKVGSHREELSEAQIERFESFLAAEIFPRV